jgi:succinate dehydrogenase / fumarate reductase cytochrome b subunit
MKKQRPISPHLQIYKPQITSVLSIAHRFTGLALSIGLVLFCWWMISLSMGGTAYTFFIDHLSSWYGKLVLCGLLFSFYYHLCNGIRHLYWDIGKGYNLKSVRFTGWVVVVFSVILTTITIMKVFS